MTRSVDPTGKILVITNPNGEPDVITRDHPRYKEFFDPKFEEPGLTELQILNQMIDSPNYYIKESFAQVQQEMRVRENTVMIAKQINEQSGFSDRGMVHIDPALTLWKEELGGITSEMGKTKEAMDQLLSNLDKIKVDCTTAQWLAILLAQYASNPNAFLKAFPSVTIGFGQNMNYPLLTESAEYPGDLFPGDPVIFNNPHGKNPTWWHENAIYLGEMGPNKE